jgi:hypothetical protein
MGCPQIAGVIEGAAGNYMARCDEGHAEILWSGLPRPRLARWLTVADERLEITGLNIGPHSTVERRRVLPPDVAVLPKD